MVVVLAMTMHMPAPSCLAEGLDVSFAEIATDDTVIEAGEDDFDYIVEDPSDDKEADEVLSPENDEEPLAIEDAELIIEDETGDTDDLPAEPEALIETDDAVSIDPTDDSAAEPLDVSLDEIAVYEAVANDDSESGLLAKLRNQAGTGTIVCFSWDDYDGDGQYEAFSFVKTDDGDSGEMVGNLWFVSPDSIRKLVSGGGFWDGFGTVGTAPELLFKACAYGTSSDHLMIWRVWNGQPGEIGHSEIGDLCAGDDDTPFLGQVSQFDYFSDGTGHTYKNYYFFLDDDYLYEYGGILITEDQFLLFDGAQQILDHYAPANSMLESIVYRSNHVINLNFTNRSTRRNSYVSVKYDDSSVYYQESGDGHYGVDSGVDNAVVPEGFVPPEGGGSDDPCRHELLDVLFMKNGEIVFMEEAPLTAAAGEHIYHVEVDEVKLYCYDCGEELETYAGNRTINIPEAHNFISEGKGYECYRCGYELRQCDHSSYHSINGESNRYVYMNAQSHLRTIYRTDGSNAYECDTCGSTGVFDGSGVLRWDEDYVNDHISESDYVGPEYRIEDHDFVNGKCAQCGMWCAFDALDMNASNLKLGVGEKYQLKVCGYTLERWSGVTFKSSKSSIAKVDKYTGKVTALKTGICTITVKAEYGPSAKVKVTVGKKPGWIKLKPTSLDLDVDETASLKASLPSGSYSKITYSSSNKSVATVDAKGRITGNAGGKATITAKTFNGKKATCTVKVVAGRMKLNASNLGLNVGQAFTLRPKDENFQVADCTYVSSNPSVVEVGTTSLIGGGPGVLTAKKVGTATIQVTHSNGRKGTCNVIVSLLQFGDSSITIGVGEERTVQIDYIKPKSVSSQIGLSFTNQSVASKNKSSLGTVFSVTFDVTVKGNKAGKTTLVAKDTFGITARCPVTVKKSPTSIKLSSDYTTLYSGERAQLTYTLSNGSAGKVSFSSSRPSVAKVSGKGLVTGLKPGKAIITAKTYNGKKAINIVTVKRPTYRALLIGEGHFSVEGATELEGTLKDPHNMAKLLGKVNGLGGGWTVTAKEDQTKQQIRELIASKLGVAGQHDVSLFMLSTHGGYNPDEKEFYICGTDDIIYAQEFASWLKAVPGRVIVIVGACHSGALIEANDTQDHGRLSALNQALVKALADGAADEIATNNGELRIEDKFVVLASCRSSETSVSYPSGSSFINWLIDGVKPRGISKKMKADSDEDNRVDLCEIHDYIEKRAGDNATQHVQSFGRGSAILFVKK